MTGTCAKIKKLFNWLFKRSSQDGPQPPVSSQPPDSPEQDDLWNAAYRALAIKTDRTQELVHDYEILLARYFEESKRVCKL
jgi:hypothetical protein